MIVLLFLLGLGRLSLKELGGEAALLTTIVCVFVATNALGVELGATMESFFTAVQDVVRFAINWSNAVG